jgi:hypothetical protein
VNDAARKFDYRVAAAWLPQLGREPFPLLFSSAADEGLARDYEESIPRLGAAGFNYIELAGLVGESGAAQLPVDLEAGFSPDRDALIRHVIGLIHEAGMQYVTALGVYSWGFEEVIRAHPELAARRLADPDLRRSGWDEDLIPYIDQFGEATIPATDVLCASREESWDWMRRSIDLQLKTYPEIDGYHIESADQGRCWCEDCRRMSTAEYHTRLAERCGEYLRQVAPEKPIFITNCGADWGSIRALPYVQRQAKYADFIIDYMDSFRLPVLLSQWGRQETIDKRREAVEALPCAYGMALHIRDGGLPRDRWFQPLPKSIHGNLRDSFEQGCRGLEFYSAGPFYNLGTEFNIELVGATLLDPLASYEDLVGGVLDRLYRPRDAATLVELREIFEDAESIAAEALVDFNKMHHTVPEIERGIPEFVRHIPIYGLASYRAGLDRLATRSDGLAPRLGDSQRAAGLVRTVSGAAASMADALQTRLSGGFEGTPLRAYTRAT